MVRVLSVFLLAAVVAAAGAAPAGANFCDRHPAACSTQER